MRVRDLPRDAVVHVGRSGTVAHLDPGCRSGGGLKDPRVMEACLANQDLPVCSSCRPRAETLAGRLENGEPEDFGLPSLGERR